MNLFPDQPLIKVVSVVILAVSLGCSVSQAQNLPQLPPRVSFDSEDLIESSEGHATIRWSLSENDPDKNWQFLLEMAADPNFQDSKIKYQGNDSSHFLSGLADGYYYFRILAQRDGQRTVWSEPVTLHVRYPAGTLVLPLFLLGLVVFILTSVAIIRGCWLTRHDGQENAGDSSS